MLQLIAITLALLTLKFWAVRADSGNFFVNPPAPIDSGGPSQGNNDAANNKIYSKNDTITVGWASIYNPFSINVHVDGGGGLSLGVCQSGDPNVATDNQSCVWKVDDQVLIDYQLPYGQSFYFLLSGNKSKQQFYSHYFNITDAVLSSTIDSSSHGTTIAPSSTGVGLTGPTAGTTAATTTAATSTTAPPAAASAQSTSLSAASSTASGGLDTGAKIGIGLGVGLGVPLIALLIAILVVMTRRRKLAQPQYPDPNMVGPSRTDAIQAWNNEIRGNEIRPDEAVGEDYMSTVASDAPLTVVQPTVVSHRPGGV